MKKPILIFDYDGTIHNTLKIYEPAFLEAYRWLVSQGAVEPKPISSLQIASWLGVNAKDMWNQFQPNLSQEYKEKASSMIGQLMVEQIEGHQAVWYPEAASVLDELKDHYTMIVLSNCKIAYREANWKEFGMERWFDRFYDCESYQFAPKTEIITEISKTYPGPYIVIGDRKSDLECARACNGTFIGCSYGFGQPEELKGSEFLVSNMMELLLQRCLFHRH